MLQASVSRLLKAPEWILEAPFASKNLCYLAAPYDTRSERLSARAA